MAKKRMCQLGKSCGATCISRSYLCVIHLPPELISQLKYARQIVSRIHGKKDKVGTFFDNVSDSSRREIYKLSREFKNLPPGSKRRAEIKRRIFELETQRGANRGFDRSYYD